MTPLIDPMAIKKAATAAVFARGQAYFEDDAATVTALDGRCIHATVTGSAVYQVVIERGGAAFAGTCECPARDDSPVCKHMVAAALAANALDGAERKALEEEPAELAAYLAALPQQRLVAMIVELAATNESLRRALQLAAAATGMGAEKSLAHFRRALKSATRTPRYVDYKSAAGWAGGVETALASLETLIAAGQASAALTLAEEALDDLAEAVEQIDDSDGEITELIGQALNLHAKAARALKPEPLEFAERLLELALGNDYVDASDLIVLYDSVLGEAGFAELERLARGLLGPASAPKARGSAAHGPGNETTRSRELIRLLDACAARRGDVDARVALRRRSLSSAYSYLEIVELLSRAARESEALDWAQEGLFVFESQPDERLIMAAVALLDTAG